MTTLKRLAWGLVLATALWSCEKEPTVLAPGPELSDYLLSDESGSEGIRFQVDSTLYDPVAGGTSVRVNSQVWTLDPVDAEEAGERLFLVSKRDSLGARGQQFWRWSELADGAGITHTLGGVTYLSLTRPFTVGSQWNALAFASPSLVVSVEGEPVAIHKDWGASIDSTGTYPLSNGKAVDAVWVSHASSENRIELRRVREVYGKGYGLLERRMDILDSQDLRDLPWEQKAQRGFSLTMKRLL